MYICTTGLGRTDPRGTLSPAALRPGDRVLVSGPVGDHGTAIMLARGELGLEAEIESDTCSLWPAVDALLNAAGASLHCMRDATRGGVASVLNELARASGVAMVVREGDVPVEPAVAGAAELLGIDPRRPPRHWTRCMPCRAASARRRSARSRLSRPGWCSWRPPSAAGA
jgi:hydrogenase expression/formation protein HypE